ncbi:DNA primase [Streptomyces sp. NPDC014995]|uniref:DNA primase n=1 Tax=Streptomyces sp. NPDC014995 TaxID=3364936 RepID=UPI0037035866
MNRMGLGLAVGAGYVLGRTKKMKLAFAVGSLVAGKRLNLTPRGLADMVSQQMRDNPQFKEIGDQLREDLRGVGKAASGAVVERQMNTLADRLHGRTAQVRDQLAGVVPGVSDTRSETDDEEADERPEEPESARDEDRDDDRDARDDQGDDGDEGDEPPRKRAADQKAPARKAPGTKAAKKAPGQKAPAGTAARKAAAQKTTAARKTATGTASRPRRSKGGGER